MLREYCIAFISLFAAATFGQATTLLCGTTAVLAPYDGTCSDQSGALITPVGANAVSGSPDTVSSTYDGQVTLEVVNIPSGLMSGYFVPCFNAVIQKFGTNGDMNGSVKGRFGSLSINQGYGWMNTCSSTEADFTPDNAIAFIVGNTTIYTLSFTASSCGGSSGKVQSWINLVGFEVFDSSGNLIPANLNVSTTTPEPRPTLLILGAGIAYCGVWLTRRRVSS